MFKKTLLFIFSGLLMMNLSGCFLFVAGVAGGAGTAVWLSGKLTQEFHASYHATKDAAKLAIQSLNLQVAKETDEEEITQIKGSFSDGREIWIDIHPISDHSTKVEVRVGGVSPDKDAASMILKSIQSYL